MTNNKRFENILCFMDKANRTDHGCTNNEISKLD